MNLHRKFRWIIECYDENKEVVFTPFFVKINARPEFDKPTCSQEIIITQFITMMDNKNESVELFNKYENNSCRVRFAKLSLLDGCGSSVEHWDLEDVRMQLKSKNEGIDGIVAEWSVTCGKINLVNDCKQFIKNTEPAKTNLSPGWQFGLGKLGDIKL